MLQNNLEYQSVVYKNLKLISQMNCIPEQHKQLLLDMKYKYNFEPKIIYDIGSSVLHWSQIARFVFPKSNIYLFDGFEPAKILYHSMPLDISGYHIGLLSDEDGKDIKFFQNDFFPGGNSKYKEVQQSDINFFPDENFLIKKSYKLDTVVHDHFWQYPDLIKIDVQGSEMDILKGAIKTISNVKFLIIEMQHTNYNDGAPKYDETHEFLKCLGFRQVSKFCDNGPDADYLYINEKFINSDSF